MLRALWSYRGFVLGSVKREYQARYRNSFLGAAWTVLQPLAMIVIYTVVFSQIMRAKLPGVDSTFAYSIYLCTGLLTWGFFAEIVGRLQNVFLDNANLLKKLYFPRICLPTIVVISASLNFVTIFGIFAGFLVVSGNFPGVVVLALVPLLMLLVLFAVGLGVALGVLNVFFRDVGQFFTIILQYWFWLTPIVYAPSILPEPLRPYLAFNPMTNLMAAFQDVVVRGAWPEWSSLRLVALVAAVSCLVGLFLFRRKAGEIVDEI